MTLHAIFAAPSAGKPFLTLPNIITLARIGMVPWILAALLRGQNGLACILFAIAAASDALDGLLARILDQRSHLGAVLDPIADKIMLVCTFLAMGWLGHMPAWLVVLVVGRDVGILLCAALLHLAGRPVFIPPLTVSKVTTFLQVVLVAYVLATLVTSFGNATLLETLVWLTAAFTAMSAVAYSVAASRWFGLAVNDTDTGRWQA